MTLAIDVEQAFLGACLAGYRDIPGLAATLRGIEFRSPINEAVWEAVQRVYAKGQQPTLHTVQAELAGGIRPWTDAAGRDLYLLACSQALPAGDQVNAGWYAGRVVAEATLRELENVESTIAQGRRDEMDADDLRRLVIGRLEALERSVDVDAHLSPAASFSEVVDVAQRGVTGAIETRWPDLNRIIHGWFPGQLIILGGRPGAGKALALDTPLATPSGWTTMGDVRVGDSLVGADGRPTRVVAATDVMLDRPCYEVDFDDGTTVVADAEHQWLTSTRASRRAATPPAGRPVNRKSPFSRDQRMLSEKPTVKTTAELAATVRIGPDRRLNHAVDVTAPFTLPSVALPADPYVLGVWLGDGTSRSPQITTDDPEIVNEIVAAGYPCREVVGVMRYSLADAGRRISTFGAALRSLNVYRNKHIPKVYLRAAREQRLALLQGMMDTDGTISAGGRCSFDVTSERLALDAYELVLSLGIKATLTSRPVKGHTAASSTCWRVGFVTDQPVFRLPRKATRIPTSLRPTVRQRMIVAVTPVHSVPVRCVQVDNGDHLYLAGRAMIPTHNSIFAENAATDCAARLGKPVFMSSMEMSSFELTQRTTANLAAVNLKSLRTAAMSEAEWGKVEQRSGLVTGLPVWHSDRPFQSVAEIRAGVKAMKRRHGKLGLVTVDYLQLMRPTDPKMPRQQQIGEFSRGLKVLAREEEVPVIALAQLKRGQSDHAKPNMSDLRESGDMEQDADVVILLHWDRDNPAEIELIVDKQRSGPTGSCTLLRAGHYARFDSLTDKSWEPPSYVAGR